MSDSSLNASALAAHLSSLIGEAVSWWLKEFSAVVPPGFASWLTDAGRRTLLLVPEGEAIHLLLRDDRRKILAQASIAHDHNIAGAVDNFLKQEGRKNRDVRLGLAIPAEKFFLREIILPREVKRSLASVALKDLLHNTPFQEADIYYQNLANPLGATIAVGQSVIQRKFVDEALSVIEIERDEFDFIEMNGLSKSGPYPCQIALKTNPAERLWLTRTVTALIITGLIFGTTALALRHQQQETKLDKLAAAVAEAQAEAHQVRTALDAAGKQISELNALRLRKRDGIGLLELLEEISRILPDHAWVQEFKLSDNKKDGGDQVILTGFSSAAASLVEVFDRSALFANVSLTAPISVDPVENRERFVLQAGIVAADLKTEQ